MWCVEDEQYRDGDEASGLMRVQFVPNNSDKIYQTQSLNGALYLQFYCISISKRCIKSILVRISMVTAAVPTVLITK